MEEGVAELSLAVRLNPASADARDALNQALAAKQQGAPR
jgi:hypothetical protein